MNVSTLVFVLIFMIAVPLVWEGYALLREDVDTISKTWAKLGREWSSFFAYGMSTLVGHFFLRPSISVAGYISEPTEVAIVLFIGWGIFVIDRGPPKTLKMLLIILLGIFVGGYIWTLGV